MTDYRFISPDGTTDFTLRTDFIPATSDLTTGNVTVQDILVALDPNHYVSAFQKLPYAISVFSAFATTNSLTLIATPIGGPNADEPAQAVITGPQLPTPGSFAAASTVAGRMDLSWTVSANAQHYQIDRALDAGFTTGVALDIAPALVGASTSFQDTGRTSSTTYFYRIKATSARALASNFATANHAAA